MDWIWALAIISELGLRSTIFFLLKVSRGPTLCQDTFTVLSLLSKWAVCAWRVKSQTLILFSGQGSYFSSSWGPGKVGGVWTLLLSPSLRGKRTCTSTYLWSYKVNLWWDRCRLAFSVERSFDDLWYCGKDMDFRIRQIKVWIPALLLTSLGKSLL